MKESPVILQLSDTQFGPRFGFKNYFDALKSLVEDIKGFKDENIPEPNIIVHCGDIADTGQSGEYRQARSFLEELCASLGIGKNKCIIIPGNHDYNLEIREGLNFNNFRELFTSFYKDTPSIKYNKDSVIYDFNSDFSISFFAWNSSQYFTNNNMSNVKIDMVQFKENLEELNADDENKLKIFLIHHNVQYGLNHIPNSIELLNALSENNFSMCLHGHIHDNFFSWHNPINSRYNKLLLVGTGSLSVQKNERPGEINLGSVPNQYNIISMDLDNKIASIYVRQHIPFPPPYGKWTKYCVLNDKSDRISLSLIEGSTVSSSFCKSPDKNFERAKIFISRPWHWTATGSEKDNINKSGLHVLALSPHPDDLIQSCSATLMKLREKANAKIWIYNISPIRAGTLAYANRSIEASIAAQFILTGMKKEELLTILKEAEKIPKDKLSKINKFCKERILEINKKYPDLAENNLAPLLILGAAGFDQLEIKDGMIAENKERISEKLFNLKQELRPDIVIAPFSCDPNSDHSVIGEIVDWVFRSQECVWHYELPKMEGISRRSFEPNFFFYVGDKPEQNGKLGEFESYARAKIFLFENVFRSKDGGKHWFDMSIYEGSMRIRAAQSFFPITENSGPPYVEAFETRIYVDSIE